MTLEDFITQYDRAEAIVLLEGKRQVLPEDQDRLVALGKMLAERTVHMTFRSGNATGADQYFSLGVTQVDPSRLQVITPYTGHRQAKNLAQHTLALDQIDLLAEPEVVYATKRNKKMEKWVDQYVAGARDRFSIKAAYLLRYTVKVLGTQSLPPATCGLFYDDLQNPESGGTGHTMGVCRQHEIPVLNQRVWMEWLDG